MSESRKPLGDAASQPQSPSAANPPPAPIYDPNELLTQHREDERERVRQLKEDFRALSARSAEKGQAALKAALLINGAAAVAVLTFMGHAVDKVATTTSTLLPGLAGALFWFVMGVLAAAVASGVTFLVGLATGYERWKDLTTAAPPPSDEGGRKNAWSWPPWSEVWNCVAIGLVLIAYGAFAFGCFAACMTLLSFKG